VSAASPPAVEVAGLTRRFGATLAVGPLDFAVAPGELFGIVGPDGAGKTTTLRMLAGVLRPSAGDARIQGVSVAREPERVKHSIAYMAQRFGQYEDLTVAENIAFYADLYRVPAALRPPRLERLYGFSGLGPFRDRLAGKLSGGMKQKLGLCCALIHHPRVLLLDEPTFGVDPISRRDLWLILHGLTGEGVAIVLSTSYLDEAERCDRVALLHEGRLIALADPATLQAALPGTLLVVRTSEPRRARDLLRTEPAVRRAALFGDALHVLLADGAAAWPQLARLLEDQGIAVHEAAPAEPSLEDAFIELIGQEAPAV
jgi:ABC-2 type transport system ATP-binding protein